MPTEEPRDPEPKETPKKPILKHPKKPGEDPGNSFGQSVEAGGVD